MSSEESFEYKGNYCDFERCEHFCNVLKKHCAEGNIKTLREDIIKCVKIIPDLVSQLNDCYEASQD